MTLRGRWIVVAYAMGASLTRLLPHAGLVLAARAISAVLATLMGQRRELVAKNLSRVMGEPAGSSAVRAASREAFYHYVYYWMESFTLPGTPPGVLDAHMSSEGIEHLRSALRAGKGAIMALPHLGSWDYAGAWMAVVGMPLTVVAEPVDPPALFDWLVRLRTQVGMTVLPLGPDAAPAVLSALRDNRVVGLITDRDIAGNGIEVSLFGETTTLPAGPATLAFRSGAALMPTAVYSLSNGQHVGVVRPPLQLDRAGSFREDVERVTRDLARDLEVLVRRAPAQWHMFQPNWPVDRLSPPARQARARSSERAPRYG